MVIHKKLLLNVKRPITTKNAELSAWAIASDGCIAITLGKYKKTKLGFILIPSISFCNTSYQFVQKINEMIGGGITHDDANMQTNRKESWEVRVSGLADVKYLGEKILPFLPIKKEQARLIIEFCDSRLKVLSQPGFQFKNAGYTTRELAIYEEMKKLNKRGIRK